MVNAHCHLELSFYKDAIPQHTGLVDFIKYVVAHRADYTMEQQIEDATTHDGFMWHDGVAAVGDISNGTASFAAKSHSRIKYHTFAEYFGSSDDNSAAQMYAQQTAHIQQAHDLGLAISPTPHSTYLVSDRLFRMGGQSQRLSIHFMETPSEVDLFQRSGAMYDFLVQNNWNIDFISYGSHSERLINSLPANVPLLLVHNTQIQRADIERIMSYFEDVTFVLCPRSNYYIESGFPPAELLRQMGARIALGTDSLSSNTSLSVIEEVKWLSMHNPSIPLAEILSWATIGGARALGMDNELGSFTVGKKCGAVLLTDVDFVNMKLTTNSRAVRIND